MCVYEETDFKALAYAIIGAGEASLVSVGQTNRLQTLGQELMLIPQRNLSICF